MSSETPPINQNLGHGDSTDAQADWEKAARSALTTLLGSRKQDIAGALGRMENHMWGLNGSHLTPDDIREFRNALYNCQRLVEEDIVPLVDGVDPYERADTNLSAGKLAEFLDLYWDHVQQLPSKTNPVESSKPLSASGLYFDAQLQCSDFQIDPADVDEIGVDVRVAPEDVVLDLEASNDDGDQASSLLELTPDQAEDIAMKLLQAADRKNREERDE